MPNSEQAVREAAYLIWEREGCPEGHAQEHWGRASVESDERRGEDYFMEDEEKILAGRPDVNMTALLTKDVLGG